MTNKRGNIEMVAEAGKWHPAHEKKRRLMRLVNASTNGAKSQVKPVPEMW